MRSVRGRVPRARAGNDPQLNAKGWPIVALVAEGCTGCTLCADVCPDGVFTVYREERTKVGDGHEHR